MHKVAVSLTGTSTWAGVSGDGHKHAHINISRRNFGQRLMVTELVFPHLMIRITENPEDQEKKKLKLLKSEHKKQPMESKTRSHI